MTRSEGEQATVWCCSQCGAIYYTEFPRCPNDGAEVLPSDGDPLVGRTIDGYVIDRLIGEGGMARVYAVHEAVAPRRTFAIKVLLGEYATTAAMRKRFALEASHTSRLAHPNIVHMHALGSMPSGPPYLVMELVEGGSLLDLIEQGPVDPLRVVALARGTCEGLAYAHEHGVIHRDLKPSNILVARSGDGEVARIADFGLARAVADVRLTTTGTVMGTPAYAAPEQLLAGKPVDHRADLYGLGMTMFEMLTGGVLPFDGTAMEIATAKAHGDPPTIADRAPEIVVPASVQAVISRLLARDPDHRPTSAREALAMLEEVSSELTRVRWWGPRGAGSSRKSPSRRVG
ncbi:MAG: serine/threonine protein kinase, partial [Myxococcota bacterium]|nr:serine/threonine protein kinase [Myxococcota bacterium]